ncbi:MAG: MerR family transcriptional regulator [Sedimentibacter sp.]|uniref:helix-turn-helix domain-containing protein n=1 Tax=Sedimentibacter sp. TaxID=1960295 RepID=UPI0031598CB8
MICIKYRVGEISKFLGVTTESLRNYQKLEIIEPKKDTDSTYKHFNSISVGRLLAMRKMRNAGYSLADISQSMKEFSLQEYYDTFTNNTQLLKQEYEYTKNLIERMENHLSFTGKLMEEQIQFKIDKSPTFYCFDYMVDNEITIEDRSLKHFAQWAEHMLFVLNYSPCSLESLSHGSNSLRIGLAVEEKYLNALNLNISEPVYMRTSKLSIICSIRHYLNGKLVENYAEKIQKYIINNNITAIGELFYVNEVSFHQNGEEYFYSKLYIPIE